MSNRLHHVPLVEPDMFQQLLTIGRNTFIESIRQPIFTVLTIVGILALVLNLAAAANTLDDDNKLLIDMGLSTLFIVGLFLAGVAFAYFLALPITIQFLFEFGSDVVNVAPRISTYIDLVLRLLVAIGLAFEMPVILGALSVAGIVTSKWLAGKRKIWFVLAFVISAFITPTLDPITQSLIAAPLIVLYEISIWLTRLIGRRKPSSVPAVA